MSRLASSGARIQQQAARWQGRFPYDTLLDLARMSCSCCTPPYRRASTHASVETVAVEGARAEVAAARVDLPCSSRRRSIPTGCAGECRCSHRRRASIRTSASRDRASRMDRQEAVGSEGAAVAAEAAAEEEEVPRGNSRCSRTQTWSRGRRTSSGRSPSRSRTSSTQGTCGRMRCAVVAATVADSVAAAAAATAPRCSSRHTCSQRGM